MQNIKTLIVSYEICNFFAKLVNKSTHLKNNLSIILLKLYRLD